MKDISYSVCLLNLGVNIENQIMDGRKNATGIIFDLGPGIQKGKPME